MNVPSVEQKLKDQLKQEWSVEASVLSKGNCFRLGQGWIKIWNLSFLSLIYTFWTFRSLYAVGDWTEWIG